MKVEVELAFDGLGAPPEWIADDGKNFHVITFSGSFVLSFRRVLV
jgi:hypothetical protein